MIKVGQLNTRHCELAWTILRRTVLEMGLDMICIQEPPPSVVRTGRIWFGYRLFKPSGNPLVAIAVRTSLVVESKDFSSDQVFGIIVHSRQGPILGISAYIQHTSGIGCHDLQQALHLSREFQFSFVAFDSNGHSALWGPGNQLGNRVGEMVEGVLGSADLSVLNQPGSPATFRSDLGHSSWIDVTAASHPLAHRVTGWRVMDELDMGSDHHLIVFKITIGLARGWTRKVRDWASVDWFHLQQDLSCPFNFVLICSSQLPLLRHSMSTRGL